MYRLVENEDIWDGRQENADKRATQFLAEDVTKRSKLSREIIFQSINTDYCNALNIADEKVKIATFMEKMVERCIEMVDKSMEKTKARLESSSPGITSFLERREMNGGVIKVKEEKEDLYPYSSAEYVNLKTPVKQRVGRSTQSRNTKGGLKSAEVDKAGDTALAIAGSQKALAATYQTKNDKFDKLKAAIIKTEKNENINFIPKSNINDAAQKAIAAPPGISSFASVHTRSDKKFEPNTTSTALQSGIQFSPTIQANGFFRAVAGPTSSDQCKRNEQMETHQEVVPLPVPLIKIKQEKMEIEMPIEEGDIYVYNPDPSGKRYCSCNDLSYGQMVACDNEECPIEWFHFPCVGMVVAPPGDWFCPDCTKAMKSRSRGGGRSRRGRGRGRGRGRSRKR